MSPSSEIRACIRQALAEDIGSGDVTTKRIVSPDSRIVGRIISKQEGVVAGLDIAAAVFGMLDECLRFTADVADGSTVKTGTVVATLFEIGRASCRERVFGLV